MVPNAIRGFFRWDPTKRATPVDSCFEVKLKISTNPSGVKDQLPISAAYVPSLKQNCVSSRYLDQLSRQQQQPTHGYFEKSGHVRLFWESEIIKTPQNVNPYIFAMDFLIVADHLPCDVVLGQYTTWAHLKEFPDPLDTAAGSGHLKSHSSWGRILAKKKSWMIEHSEKRSPVQSSHLPKTILDDLPELQLSVSQEKVLSCVQKRASSTWYHILNAPSKAKISINTVSRATKNKDGISSSQEAQGKPEPAGLEIPSKTPQVPDPAPSHHNQGTSLAIPKSNPAQPKRDSAFADSFHNPPSNLEILAKSSVKAKRISKTKDAAISPIAESPESARRHVDSSERDFSETREVSAPIVFKLPDPEDSNERGFSDELDSLLVKDFIERQCAGTTKQPASSAPTNRFGETPFPNTNHDASDDVPYALQQFLNPRNDDPNHVFNAISETTFSPENESQEHTPTKKFQSQHSNTDRSSIPPSKTKTKGKANAKRKRKSKSSGKGKTKEKDKGPTILFPATSNEGEIAAARASDTYWTFDEVVQRYHHVDSETGSNIWYMETDSE